MSAKRSIVARAHAACNAHRFEDLGELLDDDVTLVMDGGSVQGRSAFCDFVAGVVREFPGLRMELEGVIAESADTIVTMTRYVDTSPARTDPAPTGVWPLPTTRCAVHRIAAGRIVEWRDYIDPESVDQTDGNVADLAGTQRMISEQAALRRVATLVARGADQYVVFDAIVSEAAELFGQEIWLHRFEADGLAAVIAQHGAPPHRIAGHVPGNGPVLERVRASGRPARVDSYLLLPDPARDDAGRLGVVATAAAPLVVQGAPWGALTMVSRGPALTAGIEDRLAQFADLAGTAIANAQSRAELKSLADEQAALRRVAELVARGAATQEVFDQVTVEAARVLDDTATVLMRYELSGAAAEIVAQSASPGTEPCWPAGIMPTGTRIPVRGDIGIARVWRSGRVARIDDFRGLAGAEVIPVVVPSEAAAVGAPIMVEGRLWGVLAAGRQSAPLPAGTEERLARFCELVAVAIANTESRAALTTSRARIVASADEARRRLARDVHDGAQQRLVHALITLKQARAALRNSDTRTATLLDESLAQAQSANVQLRDLARGILPAALTRGGLRDGVQSLLDHIPLSVHAEVLAERLPQPVETTAYFVIAEALTNVIKHAGADQAQVRAVTAGDRLEVEVSDDGRGGADPAGGSGLIGLIDRVDAAGGSMSLTSPPGAGTTLSINLPIEMSDRRERQ